MAPAPPGAGPATAPHGQPGGATQALEGVRLGLEVFQKALPGIPMGSELHHAIMDTIKKVGTHLTEMQSSPQMRMQQLVQMMQAQKQQQPNAALAGMAGGGAGAPPGAPPAPPMMSPPGGGAPPGAPPPG